MSGLVMAEPADEMTAMKRRLEALETEVVDLRTRVRAQENAWLDERRAEEFKAMVREVLADADTRSSMAGDRVTAGWKNGFFIGSEDGNYLLRLRGLLMARHVYNHQENPPSSNPDEDRAGFELARTRFGFFGHVIDPTWQYAIWTGYGNKADIALLDVYIKKTLPHGLSVTAGQFKLPFWREWLIGEARLPLVDRSMLNVFSGSYTQGLLGGYEDDKWHVYLAFTDGAGQLNTSSTAEDTEYAVTARAEYLAFGKWAQYADVEGWEGEELMLVLGAAGHFEQREQGSPTVEARVARWTADATFKVDRYSLMTAVVGNHQRDAGEVDQLGVLLQAGIFIMKDVETHLRWEWGDSDLVGDEHLNVVTVGVDYHMLKHQVRLIFDVGYAFNSVSAFWANGNPLAEYRPDAPGEKGQTVVRSQVQLSF